MKAVLEFQYPEDEYKLEHALKGTQYYNALCEIDIVLAAPYTKADAYGKIKKVILEVLFKYFCIDCATICVGYFRIIFFVDTKSPYQAS